MKKSTTTQHKKYIDYKDINRKIRGTFFTDYYCKIFNICQDAKKCVFEQFYAFNFEYD